MTIFLTVLHVMVCVVLIVVVLLQRGKGAEIGAVFGGGAGTTVFGSRGAGNFLTKLTTGAAIIFMLTSLSLAYFAREGSQSALFKEEQQEAATPEESSPFAEVPLPAEQAPGQQAPEQQTPGQQTPERQTPGQKTPGEENP